MKLEELREIYAKTENGSGIKMEVYSVMHNHFPAMLDLVEYVIDFLHLENTEHEDICRNKIFRCLEKIERIERVGNE